MSQVTQLKAILAVGSVLTVALMWNVERDAIRGRPAHHTIQARTTQTVQTQGAPVQAAPPPQPARI
jgi:hypothetical protein